MSTLLTYMSQVLHVLLKVVERWQIHDLTFWYPEKPRSVSWSRRSGIYSQDAGPKICRATPLGQLSRSFGNCCAAAVDICRWWLDWREMQVSNVMNILMPMPIPRYDRVNKIFLAVPPLLRLCSNFKENNGEWILDSTTAAIIIR